MSRRARSPGNPRPSPPAVYQGPRIARTTNYGKPHAHCSEPHLTSPHIPPGKHSPGPVYPVYSDFGQVPPVPESHKATLPDHALVPGPNVGRSASTNTHPHHHQASLLTHAPPYPSPDVPRRNWCTSPAELKRRKAAAMNKRGFRPLSAASDEAPAAIFGSGSTLLRPRASPSKVVCGPT